MKKQISKFLVSVLIFATFFVPQFSFATSLLQANPTENSVSLKVVGPAIGQKVRFILKNNSVLITEYNKSVDTEISSKGTAVASFTGLTPNGQYLATVANLDTGAVLATKNFFTLKTTPSTPSTPSTPNTSDSNIDNLNKIEIPTITVSAVEIDSNSAKIKVEIKKVDSTLFPIRLSLAWAKKSGEVQFIYMGTEDLTKADLPKTIYVPLTGLDSSTKDVEAVYSYRVVQNSTNSPYTDVLSFKTLISTVTEKPKEDPNTVVDFGGMSISEITNNSVKIKVNKILDNGSIVIFNLIKDGDKEGVPTNIDLKQENPILFDGLLPETKYNIVAKIGILTLKNNVISFTTLKDNFIPLIKDNTGTPVVQNIDTSTPIPDLKASNGGLVPCGILGGKDCEFSDLLNMINIIVNFVLFKLAMPIAAIMFAYAGFSLVTSGGSSEKSTKAKSLFLSVVIGLVLIAAAWLIIHTISSILGYDGSWIGF